MKVELLVRTASDSNDVDRYTMRAVRCRRGTITSKFQLIERNGSMVH
jgi:hypothetical protein